MIRILTIAAVIGFTVPAFADDEIPWFEVELIVFKHHDATAVGEERWPPDPGSAVLREAVELEPVPVEDSDAEGRDERPAGNPPAATIDSTTPALPPSIVDPAPPRVLDTLRIKLYPRPFQSLPEDASRMATVYRRLVRSQAYEPLIHVGWLQPAVTEDGAKPVHVYTGMTERADTEEVEAGTEETIPGANEIMPAAGPTEALLELPVEFRTVDGTVRLSLSRFLHLAVDLVYRPGDMRLVEPVDAITDLMIPTDGSPPIAAKPAVFRLAESRRMRSQEIHYFDHPAFGVIALVTPYEIPVLELPIPQPEVSVGDDGNGETAPDRGTPATPPVLQ